jgi:hypothetical protein
VAAINVEHGHRQLETAWPSRPRFARKLVQRNGRIAAHLGQAGHLFEPLAQGQLGPLNGVMLAPNTARRERGARAQAIDRQPQRDVAREAVVFSIEQTANAR